MTVTGTMTVAASVATYTLGTAPLSVTGATLITEDDSWFPAGAGAITFGDDLTVNGTLSGAGTPIPSRLKVTWPVGTRNGQLDEPAKYI